MRIIFEYNMSTSVTENVWNKGQITQGDPSGNEWRKDACNAWIRHDSYGNRSSRFGWEIDHIDSEGGDDLGNLRPLHWKNNVAKSDGSTECPVTSSNSDNIGI